MSLARRNQLNTITGGFHFAKTDAFGNKWKTCILVVLFFSNFVFYFDNWKPKLIFSTTFALIILLLKLFSYIINKLYDNATTYNIEGDDVQEVETEGFQLPKGISLQLWEKRQVIWNNLHNLDEAAFILITSGFNPDEVYALIALASNGTINSTTKLAQRRKNPNIRHTIHFCGKEFNLKRGREEFSRIMDRPTNIFEIFICYFVAALTIFAIGTFKTDYYCIGMGVILGFSLFSLIQQPTVEPYGMLMTDSTYKYTRCLFISIFSGINCILVYFKYDLPLMRILIILIPILIVVGAIGHTILTIHYIFETVNLYLFGILGSTSTWRSLLELLINTAIIAIGYVISTKLHVKFLPTILVSIMSIFANLDSMLFSKFSIKKLILSGLFVVFAAIGSIFPILLVTNAYRFFIPGILIVTCMILPYLQSFNQYIFFHCESIVFPDIFWKIESVLRSFLVGMFISYSIKDENTIYAPLLALLLYRIAMTSPQLGSFAIVIACFTVYYKFSAKNTSVGSILAAFIALKILSVIRVVSAMTINSQWIWINPQEGLLESLLYGLFNLFCTYYINPTSFFTTISLVYSMFTGEAQSLIFGASKLFTFSAPRPYCFLESISMSNDEEFHTNETNQRIELPAYISLGSELENVLNDRLKNGQLGFVLPDSFYLFTSNDLLGIVHVISLSIHDIRFDLRCMEFKQTTSCHHNEIAHLNRLVADHQPFGNFLQSYMYRFSAYELKSKKFSLNNFSLSSISLENVNAGCSDEKKLRYQFFSSILAVIQENLEKSQNNSEQIEETSDNSIPLVQIPKQTESQFTEEEIEMINQFSMKYNTQIDKTIVHNVYEDLKYSVANINETIFDDNFNDDKKNIGKATRNYILLLLMDSVGIAPDILDPNTAETEEEKQQILDDIFDFIDSSLDTEAVPVSSNKKLQEITKRGTPIIFLRTTNEGRTLIRYGKSVQDWFVFQMNTGVVRGFWSGLIRELIFGASASEERLSITLDLNRLRNITNQSINPPVGYPVYVTKVLSNN
ncbi:hypothetical protein TVAG_266800 [Trichomonas vaginalis G3]|uniref:Pecanex C-terminal domain-containing protein n=1 Tax=Trichomonas vaginalis (strain ATCC PRA-98 / G3) TaxID=412133 RepID=A2DQN3_TRIV3|nr:pecanex family [Trichomonas vaginalis G3]EAY17317.1 hypothetical protein TVAG_266800 [Trichomonas vaginalis G3]KAI5515670.1 pecanex family [Trichomonas vaginalis G3]|eukprot:XP_001329540.1 hypothetical protein [Trichomonas vaginalis G3]